MAIENLFKKMQNIFYLFLKALLNLKVFTFLSSIFDHVKKPLDWKDKVNFKPIFDHVEKLLD